MVIPDLIFDCSSAEKVNKSIEHFLGIDIKHLHSIYKKLSPDELNPDIYENKILFEVLKELKKDSLGSDYVKSLDCEPCFTFSIYWFHASRVKDPTSFLKKGILTTSEMRGELTSFLNELSNQHNLVAAGNYPNSGSAATKRQLKDEGPHAFLFKSEAMHTNSSSLNHRYFESPELVEDIAGEIVRGNYRLLVDAYKKETIPCVVTFKAKEVDSDLISRILWFNYLIYFGMTELDAASMANTCYWGNGKSIPPQDIIKIDEVDAPV